MDRYLCITLFIISFSLLLAGCGSALQDKGEEITDDGWLYEANVLEEASQLVADGTAYMIQDDPYNSYQQVN